MKMATRLELIVSEEFYCADRTQEQTSKEVEHNRQKVGLVPLVRRTVLLPGIGLLPLLLGSFSVAPAAQGVKLAWDPDVSPVAGYRLHQGTSHGNYSQIIDVGYTTTTSVSDLTAGQTYFFVVTAYNAAGESLPSNEVLFTASSAPTPTPAPTPTSAPPNPGDSGVFIGNTTVLPLADHGYGNLLVAQKTALSQSATLKSMSFYVAVAAGKLKLGVYDASGKGGTPGKLVGGTGLFVPHTGWNTVNVGYKVRMDPGVYWVAYWPSSNDLVLAKAGSGISYYYRLTFNWLFPKIFDLTHATRERANWSLYATLTASPSQAPTPAPAPDSDPFYPLKASANKRYLVDQTNKPFMIVGDSPHSLMVNLTENQAEHYFANRQSHGINAVWTELLCTSYTGGRQDGSTYDGILPLTGANLRTLQGNINSPNPAYFKRVDDMIRIAARYGIVVFLDPYDTGGLGGIGGFAQNNGIGNCYAYGQYLGNRYKSFANIVWITGNDFQSWNTNAAENAAVAAIMQGIASVDSNHLQTTQLNYNVSGSHDDRALLLNTTLAGAYTYYATYSEVLKEYNSFPTLPVFLEEANYEGEDNTGENEGDLPTLRRQEYWTMTSGATGQMYGNRYIWGFSPGWQQKLDTAGVAQLGYMKQLFNSIPWFNLVPDQNHSIITDGHGIPSSTNYPIRDNYVTTAASKDGTLAISYLPAGQTIKVNLGAFSVPMTARWFDPTSNTFKVVKGSPFSNKGVIQVSPDGRNSEGTSDWVLMLTGMPPGK